jgi:putative tryptophan/tyrosine transport system substrate-binding protein
MDHDRRRTLLLYAGAALVAPMARAQAPGRTYRIGMAWLADAATTRPYQDAFLDGLREHGFEPGRNLLVDVRYCNGDAAKLPAYVDELMALKPDLLAGNDQVAQAMWRKSHWIPIVLTLSNDPVATGLVKSLAHPGGNVTGMAAFGPQLGAKLTELMAEFLPRMRSIATLVVPGAPASADVASGVRAAALAKGVQVIAYEVKDQASLEQAFAEMERSRPDALLGTGGSAVLVSLRRLVAENALRLRIAAAGAAASQADAGFLFSYGAKLVDVFRRAGLQAARILAGASPADLPVEQASTFELVVNLKTAQALGITVPPAIRLRADRFVE